MLPHELKRESFAAYSTGARDLAIAHLAALQRLPLSFLPSLLRELIDYDLRFPAERDALHHELDTLASLTPAQNDEWFRAFASIQLSPAMERTNWVQQPADFVEQESAYLWTTHQLDAFRQAATNYGDRLRVATAPAKAIARPLGLCVIGQGVARYDGPLFRKLAAHGTLFQNVDAASGMNELLAILQQRASADPRPYEHWYIDGGVAASSASAPITLVSYSDLAPLRSNLLHYMQTQIGKPGMGPEELRSRMARLTPTDLGASPAADPVLARFQLKVFTEGSGTQVFSTTFAQWTAREALRRAQPQTLLLRFAPRQRQRALNELVAGTETAVELDPAGSLVDADMGAYYTWLNMRRLPGAEALGFVVWFEGHAQAVAVGPGMPRGVTSTTPTTLSQLVALLA